MRRKDLVAALLASVLHGGEIPIKELSPQPSMQSSCPFLLSNLPLAACLSCALCPTKMEGLWYSWGQPGLLFLG